MSTLPDLLRQMGIAKALVVDDAFDEDPLPGDLAIELEEWTQLFDDIQPEDRTALANTYPPYGSTRGDDLRTDETFVALLWRNRATLKSPAVRELFRRYDADKEADRALLGLLLDYLRSVGLACATSGREFEAKSDGVQIIFVDLFLSAAQRVEDMSLSVNGLAKISEARKADPPLVVLMSRSNALPERRREFRDGALLFESNFRILSKDDIHNQGKLERMLRRLAAHYDESKKLAAFVHAWEQGLTGARDRTTELIRKLRLADLAQIYQLLLSAEGEPTGSYLVDIFDDVLQHELERDEPIIDAAIVLNSLAGETYPPPYVPGAPDLQDLIQRSLFQNRARLKLPGALGSRIAFGDLLRAQGTPVENAKRLVDEFATDTVFAALTPACDLQRNAAKRIMLLVGKLRPLTRESWTYGDEGVKTPVVEMPNGARFWIRWDLKHVLAWSQEEIAALLSASRLETVARLRESHALELQQKLLSSLGRVGLAAPMPATFEMRVEAYYPGVDNALRQLHVSALEDGGVCFVGRAKIGSKTEERLALTESACDALIAALESLESTIVHPLARPLFAELRGSSTLLEALERGFPLNSTNAQEWKEIAADNGKVVGFVRRSKIADGDSSLHRQRLSKAGVILTVFPAGEQPHDPAGATPTPEEPAASDSAEQADGNS